MIEVVCKIAVTVPVSLMMKRWMLLLLVSAPWLAAVPVAPAGWKLIWNDEFQRDNSIDTTKWSPCERGGADWNNTMTRDPRCYKVKGGVLHLIGIPNDGADKAQVSFLTGGITSQGKFSFKHGKIEISARFKSARGAWPALWLLGVDGGWPKNGEMDLMEHLNYDKMVYQTVHSQFTVNIDKKNSPVKGGTAAIKPDAFNTYGVEWNTEKIVFSVNGKVTHTYPRVAEKGPAQWPFDQPFYIIMSMQIGGSWVGKGDAKDYPAGMEIDWVRVYEKAGEKASR